jgi:hypothetical protein
MRAMAESEEFECRQIAELLGDYIEGSLPQPTRELIDWHIEGCPPCVAFMNTYRTTVQATRRLPDPVNIPPELRSRLLKVLKTRQDLP